MSTSNVAIRAWPWITAVIGLAIIVAEYIDGAINATWFDDHGIPSPTPADLGFLIGALGFVLIVGGLIIGAGDYAKRRRSRRAQRSD
ncbi:MAG TPA: hypothetical protein VN039_02905 [Nitrospira sp.]|nr:hypothetical protein [Nitrospira sp.]